MHGSKTKILTTEPHYSPLYTQVGDLQIEVLHCSTSHRYLGRLLCLDPELRIGTELDNRFKAAWGKFHQNSRWLTNRHISLRHRLRFLDAVVRPTLLFGLHVLPLSQQTLRRIAALQRKMMRKVVGWVRHSDEDWTCTMSRMKMRIERCWKLYPCRAWDRVALHQQCHYAAHVKANASHWPYMVSVWRPSGTRRVGRPRQRWDDYLLNFAQRRFNVNHWLDVPAANWHLYADEYVQSIVD